MQSDMHPQAICFCGDVIYNVANKLPFWTEVSQSVNSGPSEKKPHCELKFLKCDFEIMQSTAGVPSYNARRSQPGMVEPLKR